MRGVLNFELGCGFERFARVTLDQPTGADIEIRYRIDQVGQLRKPSCVRRHGLEDRPLD